MIFIINISRNEPKSKEWGNITKEIQSEKERQEVRDGVQGNIRRMQKNTRKNSGRGRTKYMRKQNIIEMRKRREEGKERETSQTGNMGERRKRGETQMSGRKRLKQRKIDVRRGIRTEKKETNKTIDNSDRGKSEGINVDRDGEKAIKGVRRALNKTI